MNQIMKLSSDWLAGEPSNSHTGFECVVCYEALDLDTACECLECEVAICKKDCELIEKSGQGCPHCRSTQGFKKRLSRHHRKKIEELSFICPHCSITLKYADAQKHI